MDAEFGYCIALTQQDFGTGGLQGSCRDGLTSDQSQLYLIQKGPATCASGRADLRKGKIAAQQQLGERSERW